ncbi:LolA family protein [Maridesulfovibrio hydrothermalis]|uniref:Outer membrane lipoprotein carrier protein LolA n=1 Tax=Maridesulfovibrio hydrothermalis AM13 = DSM 14728 TaxID=1121451 RepID=L0R9J8_9BACT|nr:outer membrane lipoprotein carrier protein LolA [Maridesulfovibrio hydrothermalis]CCO23428.1 Outer membrane lipoprotein carrier protein LolA [Maridesulfovibrio hydrothermalis AM13 = DSM 14728]
MTSLKYYLLFLCMLAIALPSSEGLAESNRQDLFLQSLEAKSEKINSIASNFTQQSYISLFEDTISSKGKFTFSRPDNLRWEYTAPFVSGFLLKGKTGLRWDAAGDKATPFSTDNSPEMAVISEQILAWTTMNISWLDSVYTIKVTNYSPAVMELTPRSALAKDFLSLIKIFFSPDATHLQGIELHVPGGDYTKINFSDIEINGVLPDGIFEKE